MNKAFITNISFPKSLNEVLYFIEERGKFDVQEIMSADYVEWTAPKDAHVGDTAYFMHSKTSIDSIGRLRKELAQNKDEIGSTVFEILVNALNEAEGLYAQVGGSVFATGTVCGNIIIDDIAAKNGLHWRSKYYAPIGSICLIKPPIHIDEFRDFITISRTGAITELGADQEMKLRELRVNNSIHSC